MMDPDKVPSLGGFALMGFELAPAAQTAKAASGDLASFHAALLGGLPDPSLMPRPFVATLPVFAGKDGEPTLLMPKVGGVEAVPFLVGSSLDASDPGAMAAGGFARLDELGPAATLEGVSSWLPPGLGDLLSATGLGEGPLSGPGQATSGTAVGWQKGTPASGLGDSNGSGGPGPAGSPPAPTSNGIPPKSLGMAASLAAEDASGLAGIVQSALMSQAQGALGQAVAALAGGGGGGGALDSAMSFVEGGCTDPIGALGQALDPAALGSAALGQILDQAINQALLGGWQVDDNSSMGEQLAHKYANELIGKVKAELGRLVLGGGGPSIAERVQGFFGGATSTATLAAIRMGDLDQLGNPVLAGSPNVLVEGKPAGRVGDPVKPPGVAVYRGAATILTNGMLSGRIVDSESVVGKFLGGAASTFLGGATGGPPAPPPIEVPPDSGGGSGSSKSSEPGQGGPGGGDGPQPDDKGAQDQDDKGDQPIPGREEEQDKSSGPDQDGSGGGDGPQPDDKGDRPIPGPEEGQDKSLGERVAEKVPNAAKEGAEAGHEALEERAAAEAKETARTEADELNQRADEARARSDEARANADRLGDEARGAAHSAQSSEDFKAAQQDAIRATDADVEANRLGGVSDDLRRGADEAAEALDNLPDRVDIPDSGWKRAGETLGKVGSFLDALTVHQSLEKMEQQAAAGDRRGIVETAGGTIGDLTGGFFGGMAGGAAGGAAAGLACGPGAPVCSAVGVIGGALVGGVLGAWGGQEAGAYAGGEVYDYFEGEAPPQQPPPLDAGSVNLPRFETPHCFAGSTLLATPSGPRSIESIRLGDLVSCLDEAGRIHHRRVLGTTENLVGRVLDVAVAGDLIRTTETHRWFVVERGWVPAGDLCPGDRLRLADGRAAAIESVEARHEPAVVYNLEVEEFHNFLVGHEGVLVHNGYQK